MELSASEHIDFIAVAWNESYKTMQRFYRDHAADKGTALARLEPLVAQATQVGNQVADWFDRLENGGLDERALIQRVRSASSKIDTISDQASNLAFPPQDVRDYDARAQSLFAHLGNMSLYYSERGITTWPAKTRRVLMRSTVRDFLADLRRLEFEREKLH